MRTGTGVPTELGWHGSRARAERLLMFDMAGALTPVGEARVRGGQYESAEIDSFPARVDSIW